MSAGAEPSSDDPVNVGRGLSPERRSGECGEGDPNIFQIQNLLVFESGYFCSYIGSLIQIS